MKKNYFMLAATTMMFAACAQTDVVNEVNVESTPQVIGFETFANKATRAEIKDVTALEKVGFSVWGYKAPTATPMDWDAQYTVFNNVAVTHDGSAWGYTDKQYWDRTSTYKFYAAAPVQPGGVTYGIDANTGMISITGAASAKSTDSNDFLIDRDGKVPVDGAYTGTEHADVDFDFHHIMSKLSFKLKAAVAENIRVTKLTMTGWNGGNGNFGQIWNVTPSSAENYAEWSIPSTAPGNVDLVGTGAGNSYIDLPAAGTAVDVQDEYIMVPQAIAANGLTFTIDFVIDEEEFIGQVGKLATAQVWGTDAHITYTISVGPDKIDFNVTDVCGWDNKPETEPGLEIE